MLIKVMRSTVAAVGLMLAVAGSAAAEVKGLEIMVAAAPGSGADQTARAVQQALQAEGLASGIKVENVPGAGGTIALAKFITSKKGRGDAVMTTFYVMIGAIIANQAPVTLQQVTPLARLSGEYEVIVVPANSPIASMADLVAELKADPGAVSWGGGSAGGIDHILAGLVAKNVGVDPTKVNFVAHAGGGEALASILGGHVRAGVSGWQEFAQQVKSGQLRAIAITSAERIPGIDVPTLKEQGIDIVLPTWRGLVAPPGIKKADLDVLSTAIDRMVKSPAWKQVLAERGWLDLYMPREEFGPFIKQQEIEVGAILRDLGIAH